jgi:hypothetical protein
MNKMKHDQLHDLLKNLTKSEKRYFRLFSKRSGDNGPKNYLHLFDIIESMKEYDEMKLIKELEKRKIKTKYLSADKNYLYTSILDALRTYNASYSAKQQVRRQLDFADILAEKGLLTQTAKILKKAKSIALDNDAIQYLPEILQIERKLNRKLLIGKELDRSYTEMQAGIDAVSRLYENEFYYRKSNFLRVKLGKTADNEQLKLLNETNQETSQSNNFAANKWFLQAEAARNYIRNDIEQEYKNNQNLLVLMESTPNWVKVNPLEYISVFSRILILSKQVAPNQYPDLLKEFISFADSVNRENRKVKARVYTIAYSTEMVRIINEGLFDEGKVLISKVKSLMEDYADIIDPSFCLNNYYKFAYMCIGTDSYDKALEYLNHLLNEYSSKLRPDIYGYAKILVCICHFELGNYSLLPHLVSTAKYYLRKENRLIDTEKILLQFINSIAKTPNGKPDFIGLEMQIFDLKTEQKAQNYFDFNRWIKAKKLGKNFSGV